MRISPVFMAALYLGSAFQQAAAQTPDPAAALSPQAKLVSDFMRAGGNEVYAIMDKNRGEFLIVDHGEIVMDVPALYGRGKGEDETKDAATTPAGIFSLREYAINAKEYEGGRGLAFLITSFVTMMIHPTWQGDSSERRSQRLASKTPDDNAISRKGCINIDPENYNRAASYLKGQTRIVYEDGGAVRALPRLVILPKDPDLQKTREIFGIPAETTPKPL